MYSRSQWPRGLRRRSTAARLLRSWVRIPPGEWIFVCCKRYVCCQLEVSSMSWSLVQKGPTDCGALLCVFKKHQEWGGRGPRWAAAPRGWGGGKELCTSILGTQGLSPRRPGFDPRTVHVRSVAEKMAIEQVFLQILQFSSVSIIPAMPHSHLNLNITISQQDKWMKHGNLPENNIL